MIVELRDEEIAAILAVAERLRKSDVLALAVAFAELNDEQQAQFFIEVARIATKWPEHQGYQWHAVGGHLRTCSCSTFEARDMVAAIASGMAG